jgi:hypothetical protein
MTAALICDGCSDVLSTRADDEREWITVLFSSVPGEVPAFAAVASIEIDDDGFASIDPDVEPRVFEPPSHFCSIRCLAAWAARRSGE